MIRNNSGRKRTRSDPDGAVLLNSVSTNKEISLLEFCSIFIAINGFLYT